ncbi:MAG TPA: anhydro-N-acetylmuramic acid kinase, partial [Acidobacteriota bacterium]|nr:anhydro-N-acetylmuramic acid kinase [Acidobacteriota bacterium]
MNAKPESRLAIGLMSGTSLDGIDAALVEVSDEPFSVRTLSKLFVPYEETVRRELAVIAAGRTSAEELCRAHVALGQLYSEAVESLPLGGYALEDVNVIGCHGQTVRHLPRHASSLGREVASTLQIGSPAVLAHRTGITVVSDFRSADIAAGGQGAPLVPMFDFLLLADETTG